MTLGCDRFAMADLHPLLDRLLLRAVDIVLEHRAPAAAGFLPNAKSLKKSGV